MRTFVTMTEERRRTICEQTGARTGLVDSSVEKDFWVCWTLQKLFTLPEWGEHLTFKGGTSLSKCWKLIERFSEDIDIVIDRDSLGFSGENAPDKSPTRKARKKRLGKLRRACCEVVQTQIKSSLEEAIERELPNDLNWKIEAGDRSMDPQSLMFIYPTVFPNHPDYLSQIVKIEIGARSDVEPTEVVVIEPMISAEFPDLLPKSRFPVRTVKPIRTFWEKAMLLHEETFRSTDRGKRKQGMARHYYDLYRLIKKGVAEEAASDLDLFQRIAKHREAYFGYTWVDYFTLNPGSLRLIPPDEQLSDWRKDYTDMQTEMFFGEVPGFDEVLSTVKQFQDDFNQLGKRTK